MKKDYGSWTPKRLHFHPAGLPRFLASTSILTSSCRFCKLARFPNVTQLTKDENIIFVYPVVCKMRLINAKTFEIAEFADHDRPPFAILSHTWDVDEVSLQDMHDLETARKKQGFQKIERCCRQALNDGWAWTWVDTCCIDKASSAELSEAINSMFQWYRQAMVCYAYISDVSSQRNGDGIYAHPQPAGSSWLRSDRSSTPKWFRRGWTLQELLAPFIVRFYDRDWNFIGTRKDLAKDISGVTNINPAILLGKKDVWEETVARRMSWAAYRDTTRVEDIAYSLLGIFNINMPLLYGEGRQAFIRLQHEIMKNVDDDTLFVWRRGIWKDSVHNCLSHFLADTPAVFSKGHVAKAIPVRLPRREQPIPTNRGLRIGLYLKGITLSSLVDLSGTRGLSDNSQTDPSLQDVCQHVSYALGAVQPKLYLAALNCRPDFAVEGDAQTQLMAVLLVRAPTEEETVHSSTRGAPVETRGPRADPIFYRIPHITLHVRRASVLKSWEMTTCYIRGPPAEAVRKLSASNRTRVSNICSVLCMDNEFGYHVEAQVKIPHFTGDAWELQPRAASLAGINPAKDDIEPPTIYIVSGTGGEKRVDVFFGEADLNIDFEGFRARWPLDPACSLANAPLHSGPIFSHRWYDREGAVPLEVELTLCRRGSHFLETGQDSFDAVCVVRRSRDQESQRPEQKPSVLKEISKPDADQVASLELRISGLELIDRQGSQTLDK